MGNNKPPKYMKQKLTEFKGEIDSTTIDVILYIPLKIIDRTTEIIKEEIEELNNTINQPNITDTYRTLHYTTAEHTFISSAHGSKVNHLLDNKTILGKCKKI